MLKSIPLPVLFGVVAGLIAVVFALILMSQRKLRKNGLRSMATVTGYREERDREDNSVLYYPIVNFNAWDGQLISTSLGMGKGRPQYPVGTVLQIAYDSKNPNRAVVV